MDEQKGYNKVSWISIFSDSPKSTYIDILFNLKPPTNTKKTPAFGT